MKNELVGEKEIKYVLTFINKLERTNYDEDKKIRSILEECIHFHLNKLNILLEHPGSLDDKIFNASIEFDKMILIYKPSEDTESKVEAHRVEPYIIVNDKPQGFYSLLNEKVKELKDNIDDKEYMQKAESVRDFIEEAEYYSVFKIFMYWSNIKDECKQDDSSNYFNFSGEFGQDAMKTLTSINMIEEYYDSIKYCRNFLKEVRKLKEKFEV